MSIKAETSFSLKDQLFNARTLKLLTRGLVTANPEFPAAEFERDVLAGFDGRELKERINWIVTCLGDHLPVEFPAALAMLKRALPPPLDPRRTDDDFGQFIWVTPGEYVARHGCEDRYVKRALAFLGESTKRFTAENAIRPFLNRYPDEAMVFVRKCATHRNYHVRRLASEGIRPLLPWAERVRLPAADVVDVLDVLHADPTRYVTRSVANTLNDLSRGDPDLVVDTLTRWREAGRQDESELDWMTRHALRTLTRQDHPAALSMLGFPLQPEVSGLAVDMPGRVRVGDDVRCGVTFESGAAQKLLVALRVHFLKANGSWSPKVFTVSKADFGEREAVSLGKKLSFRPMTTRTLYPGAHRIEVMVNGRVEATQDFELIA